MRHELAAKLQAALPSLGQDLVFADIAAALISTGTLVAQEYRAVLTASSESGRAAMLVEILSGKEDATFGTFVEVLRKDYDWLAAEVEAADSTGDVTDGTIIQRPYADRVVRPLAPSTSNVSNQQKRPRSPSPPAESQVKRRTSGQTPSSQVTSELERSSVAPSTQCHTERRVAETVQPKSDLKQLEQVCVTEEMMDLVKKNHRTSRDWTSLAHALGLSRLVNKIRVKVLVFGEDLDGCVMHLLQEWAGEKPRDANLRNLLSALRREGFNDVADELVEKFAKNTCQTV